MQGEEYKTVVDEQALAQAHRRLVADGETQFDLTAFRAPEPPAWLQPLLEWLAQSGPVIKYLFWGGLAVVASLILWALYGWLAPIIRARLGRVAPESPAEPWRPDAAPARALLAEADALAARGAFADAAHLLLLRSVEQIEARHGRLRPSWTSRDIMQTRLLPPEAARAFALIAGIVEAGIFARRPITESAWTECRSAYAAAAFGSPA